MSLYNAIHGYNPAAPVILGLLNINELSVIPRFRDAYFDWHDEAAKIPKMVLLTRTGGGNREYYANQNDHLIKINGYISDRDDDFDSTFALWSYHVPEYAKDQVIDFLIEHGRPKTLKEKTEGAIAEMQAGVPPPKAVTEIVEKIVKIVKES